MPVPPERIRQWSQWEKTGQHRKVYKDHVAWFIEWFDAHPYQAEELARRFAESGGTLTLTPSDNYEQFYHRSGLYWMAANIVFRRFGFGDQMHYEVGRAVFDKVHELLMGHDKRPFHELQDDRREGLNAAIGQAMKEAHHKLANKGADTIQILEHWLVHSAKIILAGGRAIDPGLRKRQRRERKQQKLPSEVKECPFCHCVLDKIPPVICSHCGTAIPGEKKSYNPQAKRVRTKRNGPSRQSAEFEQSQPGPLEPDQERDCTQGFSRVSQEDEEYDSPKNHSNDRKAADTPLTTEREVLYPYGDRGDEDTLAAAELSEFVGTLSDQQKAILGPLFINPHLSNEELAKRFNLTPQRIGQIRKDVKERWECR